MSSGEWIAIQKGRWSQSDRTVVGEFLAGLAAIAPDGEPGERNDELERLRRRLIRGYDHPRSSSSIAILNVLTDLARQGWLFRQEDRLLAQPEGVGGRDQRRALLLAQRTEQLREPATQEFIRAMERPRFVGTKRVSILSLLRDGRDLASGLEHAMAGGTSLIGLVDPYLEFVTTGARCLHTGYLLSDIWRYFRHTWVNPYASVPGRTMMFLIRDRAVPFHPVIGIGALGSAAVNLKRRDRELGWEAGLVLEALDDAPSAADATWLRSVLEERMNEIYRVDFLEDELLHPGDIESPTQAAIDGLEAESNRCRDQHHASMLKKDYKTPPRDPNDPEYWRAQARTPLFRSKRAKELAGLLRIRSVLNRFLACDDPVEGVRRLLAEREGKRAIGDLVRRVKATRVGTQIADLMVCGALPPYSALAAGKLVAMLAVSPEVVCEYKRRYGCSPSVIASAMAGQALVRPADLVFVGTTSLYTERPCQYDRVSIPAGLIGGPTGLSVRYEYMAKTGGWGTFQFTAATTKAIVDHTRTEKNGLRVNYVFGEGANPKLRALREGLAALGFDEEILLKHGQKRLMYGVKLVANAPEVLLGRHQVPNYLFALDQPREATKAIVQWWAERWLQKRLARSDVLAKIKEHTLVHPIRHGARVVLPTADVEQGSLFD